MSLPFNRDIANLIERKALIFLQSDCPDLVKRAIEIDKLDMAMDAVAEHEESKYDELVAERRKKSKELASEIATRIYNMPDLWASVIEEIYKTQVDEDGIVSELIDEVREGASK